MYARINLNNGCTLQQFRNDLVGLLTGTITSAAALTSSNTSTSEVINTLNAEWTFVQHITDTATRCHFVLSGVDRGEVAKTLGIVLTNSSGTLSFMSWICGAWDSVNKRPAAIDVSGWALATSWNNEADFVAGGIRNGICVHGLNAGMTSLGVFNTGAMQFQVTSEPGLSGIYSHYSSTHKTLLEIVDIDRNYWPEYAVAKWPFLAVNVFFYGQYASGINNCSAPQLVGGVTTASQSGLSYGATTWVVLPSPLSTELASGLRYWAPNSSYGGINGNLDYTRDSLQGATQIPWWPTKNGTQTYAPRPLGLVPKGTYAPVSFMPIPHRIPGRITPVGTSTITTIAYLDEIVVNGDTYVAVGDGFACLFKG